MAMGMQKACGGSSSRSYQGSFLNFRFRCEMPRTSERLEIKVFQAMLYDESAHVASEPQEG